MQHSHFYTKSQLWLGLGPLFKTYNNQLIYRVDAKEILSASSFEVHHSLWHKKYQHMDTD